MKPRPTIYNGIQMRSRLEGRYASYLDQRSVSWEYEPNAFADASGDYLPDFRITDGFDTLYVDTKPTEESARRVLAKMRIIQSSEPNAHIRGVWLDQEMEKYYAQNHCFHFAQEPGARAGIDDWVSWLNHQGSNYERVEEDLLVISQRGTGPNGPVNMQVAVVVWHEPIADLWDEIHAMEGESRQSDHPAIKRGAAIAQATGVWTCVTHDRSISPRSIEVSADGQITDLYSGQAWASSPLGYI